METTPSVDDLVLAAGIALTVGMLLFVLRRVPRLAFVDEAGLVVGARVVAWPRVTGLSYSRGPSGAVLLVGTESGVLQVTDDMLDQHPDNVRAAIVQRAGLVRHREDETGFRGGDILEKWVPRSDALSDRFPPSSVEQSLEDEVSPPLDDETRANRKKAATIGIGALLALVAKFGKFAVIGLQWLVKALKLGKLGPTALTMLASVWVYAQLWGWWFALGFIVLLFLHELGHAGVIMAKGLRTSPIVFVPLMGAFITVKDQFRDAAVEAEMAYGGPAAGALAATGSFLVYRATEHPFWLHLAYVGFLLNLFNLLPVSPLDGGRIVTAVSTWLWIVGLVLAGALAFSTGHPILLIIVILGAFRAYSAFKHRHEAAAYYELPAGYRALMAFAYFGLCGYLAYMMLVAIRLADVASAV